MQGLIPPIPSAGEPYEGGDGHRLSKRERTTVSELRHLDPQLAGLYVHGLALLDQIAEPGVPYLIAHAGRELSLGILRLLTVMSDPLSEEKIARIAEGEKHRAEIAPVLQLPPEHPLVTTWLQVHRTFARNTHYQQPRPDPEEIRVAFERLGGLLFGIIGPYFETQDELDALLAIESPSQADTERLTRCLLRPMQRTSPRATSNVGWAIQMPFRNSQSVVFTPYVWHDLLTMSDKPVRLTELATCAG